jgi:RHS repeat-associated protein
MRAHARALALSLAACAVAIGCGESGPLTVSQAAGVRVERLVLVSERALAPTVTESTYRADCRSQGGAYDDALVFVASTDASVLVIDPVAHCGRIGAGANVASADTVVIQRDPALVFDPGALDWVTLAFGPSTRVLDEAAPGGARRLRFEADITSAGARPSPLAAGVSSRSAQVEVVDGLVAAVAQRGTVRNTDSFELLVAAGVALDPLQLDWTLSIGTRSEFALGVTRTLDGDGQPLGEVAIEELGPAGPVQRSSEPVSGIATLAEQAGSFSWRFTKGGHLPVWRRGALASGQVLFVPSPWLPARSEDAVTLTALNGGEVGGEDARVRFAAGALPAASQATLTAIGPQSLPGLLPAGWSPLAAFWLELGIEPRAAGEAELRLADRLAPGERVFLARFDPLTLEWVDTGAQVAATGDRAVVAIAASGAYAVVVADAGPTAPPAPVAGAPLAPTATPFPLPSGLAADGSVTPPVAAASADPSLVVARSDVVVSHAGPLPSGLVLRTDVDEQYVLRDGTTRATPGYETFFAAFQRPGDDDSRTLHARFPLRPQVAIGPDELDEAAVSLEVLPVTAFEGGFFDRSGGRVGAAGVFVAASPEAVAAPRAVEMRAIDPARFAGLVAAGAALVAFELSVEGLAPGTRLAVGFGPQEPDAHFVLARFVQSGGRAGLEPRERFVSDEFGVLRSREPRGGPSLPGVTGSGTYVLVRVAAPQALVQGVARDTRGVPAPGLAVQIAGEPWLTFSAGDGRFTLCAAPGDREVAVTDLRNGDRGTAQALLADEGAVAAVELGTQPAGPRVVALDPADGAVGVRPSTPVRVTFSERVAPLAPGDLVLTDALGDEVPATLTTNLARTEATLLPVNPLANGALHRVVIGAAIADPAGLPLEGPREFSFTTVGAAARGAGAQLVSWEPGADTAACDDVPGVDRSDPSIVCVMGSQGTADPDVPVILVNDTTGETATVRSRADGSFESFIDAAVDDFVSATFVNANGTRIRIPVQRQLFDDGSVALFEGGGILEAESDGGPVQVIVQPGSIPNKTKFKVDPMPLAELLALAQSSPPKGGQLLSALSLTISGDVPTEAPEVSLPVEVGDLQLPPEADPARQAFALAGVTDASDGGKAYQVVDKLHYEDGRLVTRSFPFVGMVALIGSAVVEEFATIVITSIFLGEDAITTTGIVGSCQLTQVTGLCVGEGGVSGLVLGGQVSGLPGGSFPIRPLPGAVVVAQPFEPGAGLPPVNARPGRIPTGSVYAVADQEGRYVLALALANEAFGLIGREQAYQLVATHPRFPQPTVDIVSFDDFNLLNPLQDRVAAKNMLFRVGSPFGSLLEDAAAGRPQLSVGHDPTRPPPDTPAELRVFASHRDGVPEVSVDIESVSPLVAGEDVGTDDVELEEVSNTEVGNDARRLEMRITATAPAAVRLRVTAIVENAEPAVAVYPIHFGGAPPAVVDPVRSADPNDERGPFVVRTWPPEDSQALAPGDPIFVVFNEAVSLALESDAAGLTIAPDAGKPRVELDPSQREATIRFPELRSGTPYTLTLTSAVRDLASPANGLDQDPSTDAADAYTLRFETAPVRTRTLLGVESGGGALVRGNHAFVLDRIGPGDGALRVFELETPDTPSLVKLESLPGFPRDMALIPDYEFKLKQSDPPLKRDLLAVVGGDLGAGSDEDGNIGVGNAYLNIFDVTEPLGTSRVAGAMLSISASATPTKVTWSAPYLTILLSDGDVQTIDLFLLQKFLLGASASPTARAAFPLFGTRGRDENGDGDFVDEGDTLPLPAREPAGIDGKETTFAIDDTNQRILDYFFDGPRLQLGVALSSGKELDPLGAPINVDAPASYRTLVNAGTVLDREASSIEFPGTRPKRVQVLYGVHTRDPAGLPIVADLALVSLAPESSDVATLAVIDVTDPENPTLLTRIELPPAFGIPQSITQRDDGEIVLASSDDLLLLDPAALGQPQPDNEVHPAIRGRIEGAGSGARAFATEASGVNVVSLGGRSQLVQAPPTLAFVQFPNESALVDPHALAADASLRDAKLAGLTPVDVLAPGRLDGSAGAKETLDPPSPSVHYHVLVRAPGTAGAEIEVGLQSLDIALEPIGRRGFHFAPAQALREETLTDLGQRKRGDCDAPSRPLRALRLSADPKDPFYDVYLSTPFALVVEEIAPERLAALRESPEREILWSGHYLRASLEPSMRDDETLAPWASEVEDKRLRVRAHAFARSLPGDYLSGPNPPPVNGHVEAPGTMSSIAAHSGEMRTETLDLAVAARLLPIVFERFSGSQDLYDGPFGRGWDFEYNQRLVELREDAFPSGNLMPLVDRRGNGDEVARSKDLLFHTGTARTVLYRFAGSAEDGPPPDYESDPLLSSLGWLSDASAFYLPETEGVFDALVRFKDGTFGRLTPDGMQYRYDGDGRLIKIYHRYEKNALELAYNRHGELVRVEDVATGRAIDVGYWRLPGDSQFDSTLDRVTSNAYHDGKIHRLVDFTNRDVEFWYDDGGLLERREGVDVTTARLGGETGRVRTEYRYGTCAATGSAGNLVGIAPDAGSGAPLFSVTGHESGAERDVASAGTGLGGPVQITLGHDSTAAALAAGGGSSTVTEAAGSTTAIQLDERGLPTSITRSGSGGPPRTQSFAFKPDGRMERSEEPAGNSTTYVYDDANTNLRSRGNLVAIRRDPGSLPGTGDVATFAYDLRYNQRFGGQRDFSGNVLDFTLVDEGRSVGGIDYAGDGTETFSYDAYGQPLTHVLPDGLALSFTYDDNTGFLSSTGRGTFRAQFGYTGDAGRRGFATSVSPASATAAPTSIVYDELDRPVEISRGASLQQFAYDATGSIEATSTTAASGEQVVERMSYDANGFLRRIVQEAIEVDGAPFDLETKFFPDALGRVERVERPGGVVETFGYDATDQIVQRTFGTLVTDVEPDANGDPHIVRSGSFEAEYIHDGFGRLHQSITPNQTTTYEYYGNGEPKQIVVEDATGLVAQVDYEYDAVGRPTRILEATDAGPAETKIEYDGATTTITDPADQETVVTRGADGYVRSVTNGLESITYSPDAHGNVLVEATQAEGRTFTHSYSYDALDHLDTETFGGLTSNVDARPDGQVERVANALGEAVSYDYTKLGEVESRMTPEGVVLRTHYAPHREASRVEDGAAQGWSYAYDTSLRQRSTRYRDGGEAIYDFSGTSALARPVSVTLPGGGTIAPIYDGEGRLRSQTASFGNVTRTDSFTYDGLGRVVTATYPGGNASYDFDMGGPLRSATFVEAGETRTVGYDVRLDGARLGVDYPSGVSVDEGRDVHGRLTSVTASAGGPLVDSIGYVGADLVETRSFGGGAVVESNEYDARKRLVRHRYSDSSGAVLVEERLAYDDADRVVARQFLDRAGRADFFGYDHDGRLVRADVGARPALDVTETGASVTGFAVPSGVGGSWSRGFFGRDFSYDSLDLLRTARTANPDGLPIAPFARSLDAPDTNLQVTSVDYGPPVGVFARGESDALGNTVRSLLFARSAAAITAIGADLEYDALTQLVAVQRDDGARIAWRHQHTGLAFERELDCGGVAGCQSSVRRYVYDGGRRLEEYDETGDVVARFYYTDDDYPVAADLVDPSSGDLARYWLLVDSLGSVIAIADADGRVVERIAYDPYGQPAPEAPDPAAPILASVTTGAGGALRVQWSERVVGAPSGGATGVSSAVAPVASRFQVLEDGAPVNGTLRFEESAPPFGTTFVFEPATPLAGAIQVAVAAGAVADEWSQPNPAITTPAFAVDPTPGAVLFTGAPSGSTAAAPRTRSAFPSAPSFQGHFFDWDAGLLVARARVYDPATGLFLQRDPTPYADSGNLYAGFGLAPTTLRDVDGEFIGRFARWIAGSLAKSTAGRAVHQALGAAGNSVARALPRSPRLGAQLADDVVPTPSRALRRQRVVGDAMREPNLVRARTRSAVGVVQATAAVSIRTEIAVRARELMGRPLRGLVIEIFDDDVVAQSVKRVARNRRGIREAQIGRADETFADNLPDFHGHYDYVTIVGHGDGARQTVGGYTAEALAAKLKSAGVTARRFELAACNAGACQSGRFVGADAADFTKSLAARFARATRSEVEATPLLAAISETGALRAKKLRISPVKGTNNVHRIDSVFAQPGEFVNFHKP